MEIKNLVEEGRRYFVSRNYHRAEQTFLKVLRSGTGYADVFHMLGVIYHDDGKFNDAIHCLENALSINPNYVEAALNLAVLYNDLGDYKRAKALYRRIQQGKKGVGEINPTLKGKIANLHASLADTYAGIGCLEEAIDEYKKALKLCPTYKDIRTKLAVCYRDHHQKGLALKELNETLRQSPNYLPARIQRGLTYYVQGSRQKAAKEWREVLKKDKQNRLAQMYLRIGENHRKK